MRLTPLVNYDGPDGKIRTLYLGNTETLDAINAGIRSALDEVRAMRGTDPVVRMIDTRGHCVSSWRIAMEATQHGETSER